MRRVLLVAPVAIVFAVIGVGLFRAGPDADVGGPAPAFSLPLVNEPDREISLAEFRGRPVVLNFWASWCAPCREEAPELARVARLHAQDVVFLGMNILDGRQEAMRYIERYEIGFPNVRDATAAVAKRYGVAGAPETYFIDPHGELVGRYIGAFRPGELEELVERFLALEPGEKLRITGRGETRPVP